MSETMLEPPKYARWSSAGFSNYDHEWDAGFEPTALTERGEVAPHTAWDHYGVIWWQDGQFHEQVWRNHSVAAVVSRPSLQELVVAVNEQFGAD